MAELDPLVAEILLKGDDEFLSSLKKIGEDGAESIEKLNKAFESGAGQYQIASLGIGLVVSAITGLTAATTAFVEQQTELSQRTTLLAESFGATGAQLQELEAVFAASGVKVEQFERLAVRLTTTIAREWPAISESIKNYANENDASTLRVQNAILRVQDAQNKLADNSAERASQMAKDNDAVEAAYVRLEFAAQHAASEQLGALQSVRGAQLSVTAAEQHLAELEGRPPSAAEKENLAIAQAQQAVDTARRSAADALIAQQEKAAQAALTRRQQEQAYDDLARAAAQHARDDAAQRQKDENSVKEAIIARGEAEAKAVQFGLTNVGSIRAALDGIVSGNKAAATAIDLTHVSVENLTKGIIALAGETSKATSPTGFETLRAAARTFAADTEHMIDPQQRLAIVTRLSGTAMQQLGSQASDILNVIQYNSKAFEELASKLQNADGAIDANKKKIEDFRGSLASLNLTVSQLSQEFAALIAPALTAFFDTINHSLKDQDGFLHNLISGFKSLKDVFVAFVTGIDDLATKAHIFDDIIGKVDALKAVMIGLGVAIAVALGPWAVFPATALLVIAAIGAIRDHWDDITAAAKKAWDAVKDNTVVKFFEGVLEVILRIVKGIAIIAGFKGGLGGNGASAAPAGGSGGGGDSAGGNQPTVARAGGGPIDGPGSTTSDSILARLSRGEFVIKAAAVQNYGMGLFHALNNMQLPGFASGGLVASPVRAGGGAAQGSSTLNLSIDGRAFNGLRGPKSVIDDLSSFAISRQTSASGNNPSWVK